MFLLNILYNSLFLIRTAIIYLAVQKFCIKSILLWSCDTSLLTSDVFFRERRNFLTQKYRKSWGISNENRSLNSEHIYLSKGICLIFSRDSSSSKRIELDKYGKKNFWKFQFLIMSQSRVYRVFFSFLRRNRLNLAEVFFLLNLN